MNRPAIGKLAVFLLLISFFLLGADECGLEDRRAVRDFLDEWAGVQNKNPVNPDGSINPEGIANTIFGGPSNDEAGGALDPDKKLKDIVKADNLVAEGLVNHDLSKVNEAIRLRPDDLGYRNARGIVLLIQGEEDKALADFNQSYASPVMLGNPKLAQVVLRDRMARIDEVLHLPDMGGLRGKPDVIANMEKHYCDAAFNYWKATGDRSYGDKYRCDIPR